MVDYARYWHGYLLFLKPLLLFFSLSDIRMMNAALQLILAAGVLLLAFRKRGLRRSLGLRLWRNVEWEVAGRQPDHRKQRDA